MTTNKYTEALGPVFLFWISQLHDRLIAHEGRKALFYAPTGKRIADLINAYAGPEAPFDSEIFAMAPVSAWAIALSDPETFFQAQSLTPQLVGEGSLADACRLALREYWHEEDPRFSALGGLRQPCTTDNLRALIAANDPASRFFREQLSAERAKIGEWLEQHLMTKDDRFENQRYVLVDTGTGVSVQHLMSEVFPDLDFTGLFFGLSDQRAIPNVEGLVLKSSEYHEDQPETVLALHRDLVDHVLAPRVAQEMPRAGPHDPVIRSWLQTIASEQPDPKDDAIYLGILDHVRRNAHLSKDRILAEHKQALSDLAAILVTPAHDDALALWARPDGQTATSKPCGAWIQGQIALKHRGQQARQMQLQAAGLAKENMYFTAHEQQGLSERARNFAEGKPAGWHGSVAIVTRTKDRPLLFRRAAQSIAGQSWTNYCWVIVNDGGEVAPVHEIIAGSGIDPARITLIDNVSSVGMEAASNMGVRAVDTEFVVIHDDDDRWESDFLRDSIEFLQSSRAAAADFEGVVSRTWRVSEQIEGDDVIPHLSEPYMPWASEISLAQMAVGNFVAPISFLYRRWVYEDIGGYDERLPVLGDWRFNLDFLMRANIGFLDRYLAHYHHRDRGDSSRDRVYGNSVVNASDLHSQYFSVVTNGILRDPATPDGLRLIVANAHQQRVIEGNLGGIRDGLHQLRQRLDQHIKESSQQVDPLPVVDPEVPIPGMLPQGDRQHIVRSMQAALPYATSVKHILARLRWDIRLAKLDDPKIRQAYLPKLLHLIPSPADFDHITYLRDHPEIWATRFNGPDGWLPYHHYLMIGIDQGLPRPTLPAMGSPDKASFKKDDA
ncbi:glycosyltransferase family A protein [Paracoccus sp. (in: a-proteobacteria)]|uniref:glycosyltransferase family A protein n=1 Tax=Paracoccus sp. TaxID=267 RepID=UPI00396CEFAA